MSPADDLPRTNAERIDWVLAHPRVSPWVKQALQAARARDPVEVLNELEIVAVLLRAECAMRLPIEQEGQGADPPPRDRPGNRGVGHGSD